MLKKIRYLLAGLSLVLVPALAVSYASADASQTSVCEGIGLASSTGGCTEDPGSPSVNSTIKAVVTILSFIVGVTSVIMVIVGGFRYVTSGGDSAKVTSAKSTITYAIIGLVITVFAQVIIKFTLNKTSGTATTPSAAAAPTVPCKAGRAC